VISWHTDDKLSLPHCHTLSLTRSLTSDCWAPSFLPSFLASFRQCGQTRRSSRVPCIRCRYVVSPHAHSHSRTTDTVSAQHTTHEFFFEFTIPPPCSPSFTTDYGSVSYEIFGTLRLCVCACVVSARVRHTLVLRAVVEFVAMELASGCCRLPTKPFHRFYRTTHTHTCSSHNHRHRYVTQVTSNQRPPRTRMHCRVPSNSTSERESPRLVRVALTYSTLHSTHSSHSRLRLRHSRITSCSFNEGKLEILASLSKAWFSPGEEVVLITDINNASNRQFDSLEVSIKNVITVGSNEFHNTDYVVTVRVRIRPTKQERERECVCVWCTDMQMSSTDTCQHSTQDEAVSPVGL